MTEQHVLHFLRRNRLKLRMMRKMWQTESDVKLLMENDQSAHMQTQTCTGKVHEEKHCMKGGASRAVKQACSRQPVLKEAC